MKASEHIEKIIKNNYDDSFEKIYTKGSIEKQKKRYICLLNRFKKNFGDLETEVFSAPGRTELIGNHVDHNGGKALGAAIESDIIIAAAKTDTGRIRLKSFGYSFKESINLHSIDPSTAYFSSSSALMAGVCDAFSKDGKKYGAFDAYTLSDVPAGSGLSSSAAFESALALTVDSFFNGSSSTPMQISEYGKYAENVFFKKPCGLLDQLCVTYGGVLFIDFANEIKIGKTVFDINKKGYSLFIIGTGSSHSDLTEDYASIKKEMQSIAESFGKNILRDVDEDEFLSMIPELRKKAGDRAVLRALHFFEENKRTERAYKYILSGDIDSFLAEVKSSGRSSAEFLQNAYPSRSKKERSIPLAVALAELHGASARVHGGGFAGAIQAYVKNEMKEEFKNRMDFYFGAGSCREIRIRNEGACRVF